MYAGLVRYRIRDGMIDEAARCWKENIIPEATKQKGFKEAELFINRKDSTAFDIGIWESRQDCENYEVHGLFELLFDQMKEYLLEPPEREIFEVYGVMREG